MRIIGYVRVSTGEQGESGLGLKAQRTAIAAECERRGWDLVAIHEDGAASGKTLEGRPGVAAALALLDDGEADALVVAKLDRLSRSLLDFSGLMERSRKRGWALVALDLGVDTTTPSGEMVANVMATFAQFERRLIGQRTKDALAVKRSEGVQLGRPKVLSRSVQKRIQKMHRDGLSLRAIAERLNVDGTPTAHGGKQWYASTVRGTLR